jgi:hypothetical protein
MAKVKCIKMFFDLSTGANVQLGQEFEVTTDRANALNQLGFVEVEYKVEESVKPTEDKSVKPTFKKK